MSEMVRVCVDAMGGDEPPEVVLDGVAAALNADDMLEVLVVGTDEVVTPFAATHERAHALVATEVIGMDEHPAEAVRTKRDSSIVKACEAVASGEAGGFFSAGSTGAMLVAASLGVGRIRGIRRAAIALVLPGTSGKSTVMLDVGANSDVEPKLLIQFAHMGRAYSQVALGTQDPKVALLSNGSEDIKGNEFTRVAHTLLAEAAGDSWFSGNAEGGDILAGTFDVIVCDGFSGNVALKTLEGTAKFLLGAIRAATAESKRAAAGALLAKPALKGIAEMLSGDKTGGAILLGLTAPVLIGHGATSVSAVKNGTLATAAAIRGGLVAKVASAIAEGA